MKALVTHFGGSNDMIFDYLVAMCVSVYPNVRAHISLFGVRACVRAYVCVHPLPFRSTPCHIFCDYRGREQCAS